MPDLGPLVYCHGRTMPAAEAGLPLDDRGLLYGFGFFETFRTSGGRPHHWRYHRRRLASACAMAGLIFPADSLPADESRLAAAVSQLLAAHTAAARPEPAGTPEQTDAVFRYTFTAGGEQGPREFLTQRLLPAAPPPGGVRLRVLKLARDNGEWLPRPKSLNYANAYVGAAELAARSADPSDEGLFLSRDGRWVVETARQNLMWFAGDRLCYPDLALGAVAGTCLQWVLETGGYPAVPRRAPLPELYTADAVFVLNAVRGITPVREIWDSEDRIRLRALNSATDSRVLDLAGRWAAALRATAAG